MTGGARRPGGAPSRRLLAALVAVASASGSWMLVPTPASASGPAISLRSSAVSGSNVTLVVAADPGVADVAVDEPSETVQAVEAPPDPQGVGAVMAEDAPADTLLAHAAPGADGVAVLTVAGLGVGVHDLSIRGSTAAPGESGGVATNTLTFPVTIATPERATADRPDDVSGDQVHVVYAVASDGTDRRLDVDGAITNSIAAWNGWFTAQTGGTRVRLDTFQGVPDVTFVRLPESDATIAATGDDRREIEAQLDELGLDLPGKLYAVYYDGTGEFCGQGAYPPSVVGSVAALYLQGSDDRVSPPAQCGENPVGADATDPHYFDYVMIHEIVHTLGFVADCAPHLSVSAHVGDAPDDLMYSPRTATDPPWQFPAVLDAGRDDYYGHSIPGCLDLANSAFLDPLPAAAQPPPGWDTTSGDAGAQSVPDPGAGGSLAAPPPPA